MSNDYPKVEYGLILEVIVYCSRTDQNHLSVNTGL